MRLEIAPDRAGERIGQSGRVGQEMADGRWPRWRAKAIVAGRRVEGFDDLQSPELRQIFFRGIIDADPALLDELHQGHRRDRLGHRGDAEQRVRGEGAPGRHVSNAERATIKHVLAIGDQHHDPWHILALDRAAQACIECRAPLRILRARFSSQRGTATAALATNSAVLFMEAYLFIFFYAAMLRRCIRIR
jgi:hypothetical protein